ncbi:uncharacterized protein LOC136029658 [Artemia franciscana]|uniref:uncharacterized protein LOC136029658 n=1 Tax=Artemia franciscana TaxID=6661 RepID=UPI0032D9EBA2
MPLEDDECRPSIFADDNAFWIIGDNMKEVVKKAQVMMTQLEHWATSADLEFSPDKTQAMMISNRRIETPEKLTMCGKEVQYVTNARFLGYTVNNKMTGKQHVEQTKNSCIRRMNLLRMISGANWGPKPEFLLEFYTKYIRAKLEYASIISASDCQSTLSKLDTVQNSALRIAYGARKSTPIGFMLSESGLEDLQTRRNMHILKYTSKVWLADKNHPVKSLIVKPGLVYANNQTKKRKNYYVLEKAEELMKNQGMRLNFSEMLSVCNPRRPPPWEVDKLVCETNFEERKAIVPAFLAMKAEKYHGYLEIYTDGPPSFKQNSWQSIKQQSTSFQHRYGCNAFLICTDSKSVVSALKNIHAKNITREVLITCETISKLIDEGSSVVLHWIPGHRGIEGNEAADQEAKDALANGTSVEEFAPTVINNIRSAMQQMRVARAQHIQDVTGNMFALKKTKLQPTKIYSKLSREQIRIIFRLRSGHAGYGVFKARMFGEDGNCSICSVPETREHLLLRCPAHEQQRLEVKRYCRTRNIHLTVETMLGECENIEDSVEMCKLTCSYVSKIKSVI